MPEKKPRILIDPKGDRATVHINARLYPLEVIYSAAYVYLDKAHFIFDGDPKKEVVVTITPKKSDLDLKHLCLEFNNELINYSVYVIQAAKKQPIREAIIRKALATNNECDETGLNDDAGEEWVDDPEGIAKPWTPDKAKGLKKPE
jgi:His-Xaa-Ser system protein HxsD